MVMVIMPPSTSFRYSHHDYFLIYICLLLCITTCHCFFGNNGNKYLYKDDPESDPIIEYDQPDKIHPVFIYNPDNGPRVVEFYAPWCGHCQNFKPKYIKLARETRQLAPDVKFYAVSCTANSKICEDADNHVHGYPTLVAFRAGETERRLLNSIKVNPTNILEQLAVRTEEDFKNTVQALIPPRAHPKKMNQYLYGSSSIVKDYMTDGDDKPSFLYSENMMTRVVEFYDPKCETCRVFKDKYIAAANELSEMAPFYAVSCSAHATICKALGIDDYPMIRLYPEGDVRGERVKINHDKEDKDGVIHILRQHLTSLVSLPSQQNQQQQQEQQEQKDQSLSSQPPAPPIKYLQYPRTKKNTFSDAALSFQFSLKTSIYLENGPLSPTKSTAFARWLRLLSHTLPSSLQLTPLLTELLSSMDKIVKDERYLHEITTPYEEMADKRGDGGTGSDSGGSTAARWSKSCMKGKAYQGYTCGLWSLFHIMTVGVAVNGMMIETTKKGKEDEEGTVVTTMEAAESLRGFISEFFGCEVCQAHFLSMYDQCQFDRCDRLTVEHEQDAQAWKELPLWLWEAHNDVNVRLAKEDAEAEGRALTKGWEERARWPPHESCPRCWNDDGGWDESVVFDFLRDEYWPKRDDDQSDPNKEAVKLTNTNAVKLVNNEKNNKNRQKHSIRWTSIMLLWLTICMVTLCWYIKKLKLEASGRHKKFDSLW